MRTWNSASRIMVLPDVDLIHVDDGLASELLQVQTVAGADATLDQQDGASADADLIHVDDGLAPELLQVQTMAGADADLDQQDDGRC